MSTYTGKPTIVAYTQADAYQRLSDVSRLQTLINGLPDELKSKMGDVTFTDDEIIIGTPQMGNVKLKVTERTVPSLIRYSAVDSPVPLSLTINVAPDGDETAAVSAAIDADIPVMLRPLVGGKLQEAADKFGDVLAMLLKL